MRFQATARLFALVLCLGALIATPILAQPSVPQASPHAVVTQQVGITDITVDYHRPGVKGRAIWGELVPFGELWRTGANARTTVEFSTDVSIAGTKVEAGSYGLLTIPGKSSWTVILSNDSTSSPFRYDEADDAVRVETAARAAAGSERLEMRFTDLSETSATLVLAWDKAEVPLLTVEVDTPSLVADSANSAFAWQGPFRAANWALQNDTHLDDAMTWIDMSVAARPVFWNLSVKARLLAAAGDNAAAAKISKKALEAADEMANPPNDDQLDEFRVEIEGWM